ncbi:MAG: hypothetical protein WD399_03905 [Thermoleophilaceae bacterium]
MTRTAQISGRKFELDSGRIARALSRVMPEPIRDHYVVVAGRRYPPKQVLAVATGLDRADFTTHHARRILRGLGFPTARRSTPPADAGDERRGTSSTAERLRPHIGEWVAIRGDEVLVGAGSPAEVIAWLSRHGEQAESMFRVPESDAHASGSGPA